MKVFQAITVCLTLLSLPVLSQTIYYKAELSLLGVPASGGYSTEDKYTVEVQYNKAAVTGVGRESINAANGLESIQFAFNGHIYDESYETSKGFPVIYFEDGEFANFDYWNTKGIEGGSPDSFFRFFRDNTFMYSPDGSSEFEGVYSEVTTVAPEPRALLLLGIGGLYILTRRNKNSIN